MLKSDNSVIPMPEDKKSKSSLISGNSFNSNLSNEAYFDPPMAQILFINNEPTTIQSTLMQSGTEQSQTMMLNDNILDRRQFVNPDMLHFKN